MCVLTTPLLLLLLAANEELTYYGDMRPLLEQSCSGCHAAGVTMGSLNLDSWEGVRRGGNHGTIVVPGRPAESRLLTMLTGEASPAMPMDGKVLPRAQIDWVRRWIAGGAAPGSPASLPRIPLLYTLAALPGGRAAVGRARSLDIVETASGRLLASAELPAGPVRLVAISAGGSVAAAGAHEVRRWRWLPESLRLQATGPIALKGVEALAWSPDGALLATAAGGRLHLWNAEGREMRAWRHARGPARALAFSPDGARVLLGGAEGEVEAWDAATGRLAFSVAVGAADMMAFSADGRQLAAAGAGGVVKVWQLGERAGTWRRTVKAHDGDVLRLAWSADGAHLATAGADLAVRLFRADTLEPVRTWGQQADWTFGLAFAPEGSLVTGHFTGALEVYRR